MTLLLLIVALTVLVLLLPFLDRYLGRSAGWLVGGIFLLLGAALLRPAGAVAAGGITTLDLPWIPAMDVGLRLRLDGLGLTFALVVLGIGALVKLYSARYFPRGSQGGLFAVLVLFALGMLGIVLADDLVLLYVSWEITTICSFLLIGREGPEGSKPAVRTVVTTAAGGMALLVAIVVLAGAAGTTQISQILADTSWTQDDGVTTTVIVLLLIAAFTKSAQFPLHFWLPDAMAASTPVSAYLHAATMVKAGVYLVLRFSPAFADDPRWQVPLLVVGLLTAVYGAGVALAQTDLKKLLAYSTISQLGLMLATAGLGSAKALDAVVLHVVAHALFKATLFMTAGLVEHQTGSREIPELSGLRRTMPVSGAVAALAGMALAGVPPLLGFISKEKLFAGFAAEHGLLAWGGGALAVLTSAFTVAYAYRFLTPYLGKANVAAGQAREAPATFLAAPAIGAAAGLLFGLWTGPLENLINRAGQDLVTRPTHTSLSLWHGLTPELGMSAAALATGGLLCLVHRPLTGFLTRHHPPVTGVIVFDRLAAALTAAGRGIAALTNSASPSRHLLAGLASLAALALAASTITVDELPAAATRATDWLLLAPLVAATVGAVLTRSRMALLILVGIAGLTVSIWFVALGGADLAMAQLLVEILIIVVAVLVLRRLPRTFPPSSVRRRLGIGVIAVGGGLLAGIATYALTGRRGRSPAAQWYIENTYEQTHAKNIVNAIITEFRALDTLAETAVLSIAALSVVALCATLGLPLGRAERGPRRHGPHIGPLLGDPEDNTIIPRTVGRAVTPALGVLAGYLLLRGHLLPGGGFVAGLVAGAGMAIAYLSAPSEKRAHIHLRFGATIAAGVLLALLAGALGFLAGGFLVPLSHTVTAVEYTLTTALIFDAGAFVVVLGTVTAFLQSLGTEHPIEPRRGDPHGLDDEDPDHSIDDAAAVEAGEEQR